MSTHISRRDFCKGAAAGTTAIAAGSIAATALADEAAAPAYLPEAWDFETDVLVIGYGGAGMWAAMTAFDEGASEVLVLEKAPERGGGNSSINLGEFTCPTDPEGVFKYIKGFTRGRVDDAVIQAWANEAMRNGEYCDRWGLPWTQLEGTGASGGTATCEYPFLEGAESMGIGQVNGMGMEFWNYMDAKRQELGIPVLFGVTNEELIQNPETKEILGCYADYDGKRVAIKARKGTIMTIGGFEFNEELKAEYLKVYPAHGFYGWPFNTGDGIAMVQHVGAQLWHMNCMIGGTRSNFRDPQYPFAISASPRNNNYIWIDRAGKRWHNEKERLAGGPHNGWHAYTAFNESICDFNVAPYFVICDQSTIDAGPLSTTAAEIEADPTAPAARGMVYPGLPDSCYRFPGWSDDNSAEIERGWLNKSETVEELCEKLAALEPDTPIDPAVLQATIDEYNAFCEAGEDAAFGRDPETLAPLQSPYYAWAVYPGGCSTLGGPKKNENGQVLDTWDQPIPRLYAGGCFGNIAAHTYGISGGNNAENMIWGRICARHASSLEPWDAE